MAAKKKTRAGSQKAKMGRPAVAPETVQRNRVVVTLTDAELKMLRRFAGEKDLPLGTAVRDVLVRALKRRK